MVPGGSPLIDIGYKYNVQKVLYFIVTENIGITISGITYLSKYPDLFYNVAICPVAHPLVLYKLFGSVNEIESHNKSMKSDLVLGYFWVTQCGWLQLCTEFSIVITITNLWKIFPDGVKIYHLDKLIGTREFLEQLVLDLFNNNFQLILGPRKRTYFSLMRSIMERQFLLAPHFIFPVTPLVTQRSALFLTSLSTVLPHKPLLWWILRLNLITLM